jgi:uncharacterized protein (UPF0332 family)
MILDNEKRVALIKYRIQQARNAISDVEYLIIGKKWVIAVNRIYYGMFYSLTALALLYKFETSKHQQLIGWFNKNFIKPKIINLTMGEFLIQAYEKRNLGDYEPFVDFRGEDVEKMLINMQDFINALENHIIQNLNKSTD